MRVLILMCLISVTLMDESFNEGFDFNVYMFHGLVKSAIEDFDFTRPLLITNMPDEALEVRFWNQNHSIFQSTFSFHSSKHCCNVYVRSASVLRRKVWRISFSGAIPQSIVIGLKLTPYYLFRASAPVSPSAPACPPTVTPTAMMHFLRTTPSFASLAASAR